MTLSRLVLVALPAFALSACAVIPQAAPDGYARLGQSTRVGSMIVRPDAVTEDSRCPMNARCIWAGRVVLDVTVWQGDARAKRQLTLGEPAADGLVLDSVEPGRMAQTAIEPKDYRFHFSGAR